MPSPEIITSIKEIYARYQTPQNLQEHMRRAAAVGQLICDNWTGPKINPADIIAVLLAHDLGNLVKMDLDTETGQKLLNKNDRSPARIALIKQTQQEFIKKYGRDDHIVTEKIVAELKVNPRFLEILRSHIFTNNPTTVKSKDWDTKLAAYADQRIGPHGVLSLNERFRELKARYAGKNNPSVNTPKLNQFIKAAFQIEEQVLANTTLSASDITDAAIQSYIKSPGQNS